MLHPFLQRHLISQSLQTPASRSESGLTLLECLVAIVMLAVVGVAITPPIFLATASRVQNNRAEKAIQIAQGEVDKVRVLVELGAYSADQLPQEGAETVQDTAAADAVSDLMSSTYPDCDNTADAGPPGATELLQVDVTGDESDSCQSEFLVQIFRSTDQEQALYVKGDREIPISFALGVRVWADTPLVRENLGSLETEPASLTMTTGLGEQSIRPLAVLYTNITRSDAPQSYEKYCYQLGGSGNACEGLEEEEEP